MAAVSCQLIAVVDAPGGGIEMRFNLGPPPLSDQWTGEYSITYQSQQDMEDSRLTLQPEQTMVRMALNEWAQVDPNYQDRNLAVGKNVTV